MRYEYTIEAVPVTKKNGMRIVTNKKGVPFLLPSKQFLDYEKVAVKQLLNFPIPEEPIEYPVNVQCIFTVPTRRRCDLSNHISAISDILVNAEILSDDNSSIIKGYDGSRVVYEKGIGKTEIVITPFKEE